MRIGEVSPVVSVATVADPGAERHEAVERRALLAAVKELDLPELKNPNQGLSISYDREARQSIVQIIDKDSGEVMRQIPGKDVLARAKYYRELSGL